MPELPEVETIRRDLLSTVVHKRISRVLVRDRSILEGFKPSGRPRRRVRPADFAARLEGRTIQDALRRGKYLIFPLSSGESLLCHLRMTGQLVYGPPRPEARAQIFLEGTDQSLGFCDTRRFGELWLSPDWTQDPSIRALGPEPLANGWDGAAWGRSLRSSRAKIQAALLDQRRLAGLGNIYVTEALFLSGLRPTRRCHTLRAADIPPLLANVRRVLEQGLRKRGVSFYSYRDGLGRKGRAQDSLLVYGREGEPCVRCRAPLKGTKISGRGTVYCPRCQK